MKRNIKTVVLFLLLLALVPATVLAAGVKLPDFYQDSYYAELSPMYQRLKDAQEPKIVVVGGSNVAFGLDSALLEQVLAENGQHYTVCPFGLYAAVGTSAMLDLSVNTLKKGDIVVLALEPTSETMSGYFGATAFWKCTEGAAELLFAVSGEKQEALAGNYVSYLQERCSILDSGVFPKAEGVYAKSSFNDRCDLVFDRPGNIMALGFDADAPVDLGTVQIDPAFAKQVNAYCKKAREVGAQVVLSFCPVNRTALTGDADTSAAVFFALCNDTFDCPVISNPNAYILDSGWFYDSNFHLNTPGAEVRTYMLAEDLLTWLGCYEIPEYDLPSMPGFAEQAVESTAETGHFTYEAITNADGDTLGYRISGLTETGREETQLTAPAAYEGKPVIGFNGDALTDAADLVQLRLPESIESLPDGLFANCRELTQLILEHGTKPCSVTEHTFDSAPQVKILVPADAFPMYRDGYGCENNPWTPYLDRIYTF